MSSTEVLELDLDDLNEKVSAGITWLNEDNPGWLEKVDLDELRMASPSDCIIGQTKGNYFRYIGAGHATEDDMVARGFSLPIKYDGMPGAWRTFTELWKERIEALRAA